MVFIKSFNCICNKCRCGYSDQCRTIVKRIKEAKLKVQAQVQGEQVRVTGKKRDDLQQVMALLREEDFGAPLQFSNFRD